jgi:hypothetical protein
VTIGPIHPCGEPAVPTERFRCSVSFDPSTLARLGIDSSLEENKTALTINGCLLRFAWLIEQAALGLQDTFSPGEWGFLSDALRKTRAPDCLLAEAEHVLALLFQGATQEWLDGLASRWLLTGVEQGQLTFTRAHKLARERLNKLVRKLKLLGPFQNEVILAAVRWYWQRAPRGTIDRARDEWWAPEFRVRTAVEGRG